MARFAEKCRAAGGAQPGQQLRRASLAGVGDGGSGGEVEGALHGLVDKGLLKAGEKADRYFLTAAGVELLGAQR